MYIFIEYYLSCSLQKVYILYISLQKVAYEWNTYLHTYYGIYHLFFYTFLNTYTLHIMYRNINAWGSTISLASKWRHCKSGIMNLSWGDNTVSPYQLCTHLWSSRLDCFPACHSTLSWRADSFGKALGMVTPRDAAFTRVYFWAAHGRNEEGLLSSEACLSTPWVSLREEGTGRHRTV